MSATETIRTPEYNVTGQDYQDRRHFRYAGPPLIDVHAHVMRPRNFEKPDEVIEDNVNQARAMLAVAEEFGIARTYTMCPPDDIPLLRDAFGDRLGFNGVINKKKDEPDDAAYRLLDRYVDLGVEIIKFWSAPRGRERGLFVDAPWRIEAARCARAAGIRIIMVHVADPDVWFQKVYTDAVRFGTKAEQYPPFCRMLEMFPDLTWIAAHMGGDPEHADHLQALLGALSELVHRHQRGQVANPRGVGSPRRHPRFDLPSSDALSVRLRSSDAARPGPRTLRQPLLVRTHALGERLAGTESHPRSRFHAAGGWSHYADAARLGSAAGRVGTSVSDKCAAFAKMNRQR